MKPGRDITKTRRILAYLAEHEFSRRAAIADALKLRTDIVAGILNGLRKRQAVDVVIEADGVGWWFATPETDNRTKSVQEMPTDIKRTFAHRKKGKTAKKIKS